VFKCPPRPVSNQSGQSVNCQGRFCLARSLFSRYLVSTKKEEEGGHKGRFPQSLCCARVLLESTAQVPRLLNETAVPQACGSRGTGESRPAVVSPRGGRQHGKAPAICCLLVVSPWLGTCLGHAPRSCPVSNPPSASSMHCLASLCSSLRAA
jgi:hypothetical protein